MTIGNIRRTAAVAVAMIVTLGSAMTAQAQKPTQSLKPPVKPATGGAMTGKPAMTPLDAVKASMKARFGFSDAQADTVAKKALTIAESYRPKLKAIQAKYGTNPTPEMQQKRMAEIIPIVTEISKKTNAVLLSVATKEQRPRIMAQMKREQMQLDHITSGGGAPPKH